MRFLSWFSLHTWIKLRITDNKWNWSFYFIESHDVEYFQSSKLWAHFEHFTASLEFIIAQIVELTQMSWRIVFPAIFHLTSLHSATEPFALMFRSIVLIEKPLNCVSRIAFAALVRLVAVNVRLMTCKSHTAFQHFVAEIALYQFALSLMKIIFLSLN